MALDDVEAIKQLKYAYFRLLDSKRFEELGELLTAACTAAYEDGKRALAGREAIVRFLTESLADPGIVTMHHGHHPEIVLAGDGAPPPGGSVAASGVWYLHDRVIIPAADLEIGGTALYHDEYVKSGGRWLIAHTGYERIFEEHRTHATLALRSFHSRF